MNRLARLRVACLVFVGLAITTRTHAQDSWYGSDKRLHLGAGMLIAGSAKSIGNRPDIGLIVGVGAAIGKEMIDMHRVGHVASYRDAAATIVGSLIAAQTPNVVITPLSAHVRFQW